MNVEAQAHMHIHAVHNSLHTQTKHASELARTSRARTNTKAHNNNTTSRFMSL